MTTKSPLNCVSYSSITELMNMDYNSKYRTMEFYGGKFDALQILKVSRFGAIQIYVKGAYTVFSNDQPIEIDEYNSVVKIGTPDSYIHTVFPYIQVFYT